MSHYIHMHFLFVISVIPVDTMMLASDHIKVLYICSKEVVPKTFFK